MPSYVRSGAAIAVSSLNSGTQMRSTVKAMDDGGFMVFWYSSDPAADGSGYAVRARRFDAQGVAVGAETLINTSTTGDQVWPRIATLNSGAYVIAWETSDFTQDGSGTAIKARMFSASGAPIGGEFLVNTHVVADQKQPNVTALADGGFLIAWQTTDPAQDGQSSAIKAQRFDSSGAPVGAEFLVNAAAPWGSGSPQSDVDITGLANGGFVASWQAASSTTFLSHVKVQIFAADGTKVGPEFMAQSETVGHNSGRVAALQDGGFLLTWNGGGSSLGTIGQFFDSAGNKSGAQFALGSAPEIVQRPDGTILIASGSGTISAQLYNTAGQALGPKTLVHEGGSANGVASGPSIAMLANGNFVLSYDNSVAGDINIRAQIIRPNTGLDLGAPVRAESVAEDGFWMIDVPVQMKPLDSPGMAITYSIAGGADAALFFFSPSGQLRFQFSTSTNYEAPVDSNGDNVYDVIIRATDGEFTDEQTVSVTVTNVNEAPKFTSHGVDFNISLTVAENQSAVTTFTATDPDGPTTLTYSISSGADRARFAINASTGVLTFVSPPNFEARSDADGNNVYQVTVSVSDGQKSDTKALSITVSNVNEDPIISGSQTNYFKDENDLAVGTLSATDGDGDALTWSIAGGADAALFAIDPVSGALRFVTAPNFEAPADAGANNVYNVIVAVSDGSVSATRALTVNIANREEGPVILSGGGGDSASVSFAENSGIVTTIVADDPDVQDSFITYRIAGGADAAAFTIDIVTGQLRFKSGFGNFEAPADAGGDNVYNVIVSADDGWLPADTQALSVTVTDANDAPVITSNGGEFLANVFMAENLSAVTTVAATDADGNPLTYAITGGADAALFAIDAQTGFLSFISAPDREAPRDADANNSYLVTVSASDGAKSTTQQLTVRISDTNEAPVIISNGGGNSAAVAVAENGLAVTTVTATDPEGKPRSYAISGGADASLFAIDPATGALRFLASPDHEQPADSNGDNVYDVVVSASDGVLSDTQALAITVGNVNERPVIVSNGGGASASVELDEGQGAVTTVVAADPDGAGSVTYSISGGAHAALFAIDAATGALSFTAAPDYEAPLGGSGNLYSVTVTASDGELSSSQSVQVLVRDVNEAVAITSGAAASVAENDIAVMTVTAQDLDGDMVSFAISGGADAALFAVDPETGALSFLATPNFEAPADADGDNIYEVRVSASDGALSDSQTLLVTVNDVNEGVTITSGASASVVENGAAVTIVTAQDLDGDSVSFAISGGADSAMFAVDAATGALSFLAAPNFEAPADSGGDNVYEVEVSASDGTLSASKAISVTVTNQDEAIVIVSGGGGAEAAVTVNENDPEVMSLLAVDPDGSTPSFSIMGGADAASFYVDPVTQSLRFHSMPGANARPDFETPRDSDGDNVYEVIVATSNGHSFDWQTILVTVANVYEGLGLGPSVSFSTLEGTEEIGAVSARREAGLSVAYSITGGPDASLFSINPVTGAISWVDTPDFEGPRDSDGNNVYHLEVTADDGVSSESQIVTVTVGNVDEPVVILSYGGAGTVSLTSDEGELHVGWVDAADPEGATVAYAIVSGADSGRFTIDSSTGALSFASSAMPNFESPADSDADNVYEVTIEATAGGTSATQAFSVTVADVDEPLAFTSYSGGSHVTLAIGENSRDAAIVAAEDPDGGAIVYSIVDSHDGASFTIDAQTGLLQFLTAPNHESPADLDGDNVYTVLVAATDGAFFDYQTISIQIGDVNERVTITSAAAMSVAENGTAVSTVVASDPDGDSVSYAIAGGADSSLFAIDAVTGELSFVQAPDFEAPADSDGDNVYDVVVSATDGALAASQAVAVTVSNVSESVAITSGGGGASATVWTPENGTAVTVAAASDPDGGPVTYAITGGADADRFTIDSSTGALAFVAAPDFETTRGAGGGNDFYVTVSASDGSSTDSQALTVILENVVEGLFITSYGGAESVSVTLTEGYFSTYDVDSWDDVDVFAPVVYSISGADAAFFTIDHQGRFSFDYDAPPNFEGPADADGDNVYEVTVTASISTYSDSQAFSITVVNRDENVVFTSHDGQPIVDLTVAENGSAVTTVSAVDPEGEAVSYAIAGGADAARFTIDSSTGVLAFVAAPDFEDPTDSGWDNVYNVTVAATDGTFTSSQFFSVTVGDIDEPVEILSYGGASAVALTLTEGTSLTVGKVEADDEEDWTITYSITGGADAALFQVNAYTGVLAFNYGVYPDFEAPSDAGGDNVYDVVVTASSSTSSADQAFAITVADRNEGLWITSDGGGDANLIMNEGDRNVTTVTTEDQDGDVPTYSIVGGADSALFAIDPVTGVLTFIAAPDYEAPSSAAGTNFYMVEVGASDGEFMGTQRIRIQIGNVNEKPAITSGGGGETAAVTVNENGLAVTSIAASDPDGNTLTWSITGGADASRFTIESWSGVLRFVQGPNFEAPGDSGGNNVYDVVVSVTDGLLTDSQAIAVTVANLAEIVTITSNGGGASAAVAVAENGTAVATVAASNPDGGGAVTYAIAGGADAARFTINASTGILAFVTAPNFEAPADAGANNVYDVIVSAANGATVDTQALAVTVSNVNEQMAITSNGGGASAAVSVTENGNVVTTVVGTDPDGGPVTYVILNGGDSGRFTINATTGVLAFVAAPNFEAPGDLGGDNVYNVTVMASDGLWSDTQAIAVTVGNLNEAPIITSSGGGAGGAVSVAENGVAVTVVAAMDPEGSPVTYSIAGGADAARFTINAQTGALQFLVAPDWELPADSNGDNVYAVVVRSSDGQLFDEQALNVTVTNTRDGNNVTGTSGGDTISATSANIALRTSNEEDLVFGRDGHDNIQGMAGDDELYGEAGNDVLVGGEGADRLLGGLGKDQFIYNSVSESSGASRDLIMDFSRAQADKISLSAIDANSVLSGNQAFTFIGASAFSNAPGQLRFETSGGMTTIWGDVNGDGVADLQIQLSGSIALVASDFVL